MLDYRWSCVDSLDKCSIIIHVRILDVDVRNILMFTAHPSDSQIVSLRLPYLKEFQSQRFIGPLSIGK